MTNNSLVMSYFFCPQTTTTTVAVLPSTKTAASDRNNIIGNRSHSKIPVPPEWKQRILLPLSPTKLSYCPRFLFPTCRCIIGQPQPFPFSVSLFSHASLWFVAFSTKLTTPNFFSSLSLLHFHIVKKIKRFFPFTLSLFLVNFLTTLTLSTHFPPLSLKHTP